MPHHYRHCRRYSIFSPVLSAYRIVATTRGNQCTQTSLPYIYYPQPPYHNRTKQPPSLPLYHPSKNHQNPSSSLSNPLPHHLHLPVYVYTVTPLIVPPSPPQKNEPKQSTHLPHRCSPSSDTLLAPQGAGSASKARTRCSCQCLHRGRWFRLTRGSSEAQLR